MRLTRHGCVQSGANLPSRPRLFDLGFLRSQTHYLSDLDHLTWNAHYGCAFGNIPRDKCIGGDSRMIPDTNIADNGSARPNEDIIAQNRIPYFPETGSTNCHVMRDVAILPDDCTGTYMDTITMRYAEARAD